jgi:hypothetical protein
MSKSKRQDGTGFRDFNQAYSASIEEDNNTLTSEEIENYVSKEDQTLIDQKLERNTELQSKPTKSRSKPKKQNEVVENRVHSNNPDWKRILNAYYENPNNPNFSGYVITVNRKPNKTILTWNGKSIEV